MFAAPAAVQDLVTHAAFPDYSSSDTVLEARAPSKAMLGFLINRNSEITNICCFTLLTFRIICYIAVDD